MDVASIFSFPRIPEASDYYLGQVDDSNSCPLFAPLTRKGYTLKNKKAHKRQCLWAKKWSGRADLNGRPLAPQTIVALRIYE